MATLLKLSPFQIFHLLTCFRFEYRYPSAIMMTIIEIKKPFSITKLLTFLKKLGNGIDLKTQIDKIRNKKVKNIRLFFLEV